jgi:hypothetical protein
VLKSHIVCVPLKSMAHSSNLHVAPREGDIQRSPLPLPLLKSLILNLQMPLPLSLLLLKILCGSIRVRSLSKSKLVVSELPVGASKVVVVKRLLLETEVDA